MKGSWQAAAWLLERRLPAEFSQPQVQLSNHFAIKADFNIVDNALALLQASPEAARALAGFERKTLNLPEQANEATIPK